MYVCMIIRSVIGPTSIDLLLASLVPKALKNFLLLKKRAGLQCLSRFKLAAVFLNAGFDLPLFHRPYK